MRIRASTSSAKSAFRGLALLCLIPLGTYLLAALVLARFPANPDWTRTCKTGITIFVQTNGVHTGIVLPAGPHRWRAFGWGDRDFYLQHAALAGHAARHRAQSALVGSGSTQSSMSMNSAISCPTRTGDRSVFARPNTPASAPISPRRCAPAPRSRLYRARPILPRARSLQRAGHLQRVDRRCAEGGGGADGHLDPVRGRRHALGAVAARSPLFHPQLPQHERVIFRRLAIAAKAA